MKQATTSSFVLTLRLDTDTQQYNILEKRFNIGSHIKNVMIKEARKRIKRLEYDYQYKRIIQKYKNDKVLTKEDKEDLIVLRSRYELSEYHFHAYLAKQNQLFKQNMDINTVQKIASAVWQSVSVYLFRNGKRVSFEKKQFFSSLEGKTNTSGIRFKENAIHWKNLIIPVRVKKKDGYVKECLSSCPIKYCRLVRKWHKHQYRYYAQLVLNGIPPLKHQYDASDTRTVGIDPGTSTVAVVSKDKILLEELGKDVFKIDREIIKLQQKLDKQRRINNPDNYNDDGTIKRNTTTFRRRWQTSHRQQLTSDKIKTLYVKRERSLKQSHNILANRIIKSFGTDIVSEKMSYKGLQKRSSKTEISEKTGKFKRKKRFGKSLLNHAPSMFLSVLDRKLNYIGKHILYVDTYKTKCSQLNHITGEYVKSKLSERWKDLDGTLIQRDIYSAYLLQHAEDTETININECIKDFKDFATQHNQYIENLRSKKMNGEKFLSCMGI